MVLRRPSWAPTVARSRCRTFCMGSEPWIIVLFRPTVEWTREQAVCSGEDSFVGPADFHVAICRGLEGQWTSDQYAVPTCWRNPLPKVVHGLWSHLFAFNVAVAPHQHWKLASGGGPQAIRLSGWGRILLRASEGEGREAVPHQELHQSQWIGGLCLLGFDPDRRPTMELASFPCTSSATRHAEFEAGMKDTSHQRGKFENLHRLGFVLDAARSVRFLLADSHASHEWSHRLLLGQTIELPDAFLSEMVFWKDLTFHPLPRTKHHLDYRLVKVSGEHFGYLPGVAHIQKNAVEQLRSSLRTVHFGKLPCDGSAMLALGMWPASYIGSDTMSDQQAALWSLECVSSIWFLWIMDLVVFLLPDDPKEILVVTCQCFECFETIQLRPFERFP